MALFKVSFIKKGEQYELVLSADNSDKARNYVAVTQNIPSKFEITEHYYNTFLENNHVGAVVALN